MNKSSKGINKIAILNIIDKMEEGAQPILYKPSGKAIKDGGQEKSLSPDTVPCFCSQRWILSYSVLFGFVFLFAVRVNFSMALVCMVKYQNSSMESDVTNVSKSHNPECVESMAIADFSENAEFDWSRTTRSSLLASFFYGYICTQIPGGWLADRFGGKRVFGVCMIIAAISTLLTPVCARASVKLVYVLRVILGLSTGVVFPAVHSMWGRWAPPLERSKLIALSNVGPLMGNVLTFSTSGLLCEYGFDNGWGSIFYIIGGLTFIWALTWFYFTADTPEEHPRITDVERKYIDSNIEYDTTVRTTRVPWRAMWKSNALWACITAHVCNNWTNYTLHTSLPAFMREVLKFDIKSNGALSAIPYICQGVSILIGGQIADFLRSRGFLNTTQTRKIFQLTALIGAGLLVIGVEVTTCRNREIAVVLLSMTLFFTGFSRSGYLVNHLDFAPKYAGILLGITNTFATIPGMVAPIVAGVLTPDKTQEQWRNVFYVCAAFDLFGAIVFGVFASGEVQTWAKDDPDAICNGQEYKKRNTGDLADEGISNTSGMATYQNKESNDNDETRCRIL